MNDSKDLKARKLHIGYSKMGGSIGFTHMLIGLYLLPIAFSNKELNVGKWYQKYNRYRKVFSPV